MIEKATWSENHRVIEVIIDGVPHWVPDDMMNSHRQELEKWVAEGNAILPYTSPPTGKVDAQDT